MVTAALCASIATSPRRWVIESPELATPPVTLGPAAPSGQRVFEITVPPELLARDLPVEVAVSGEVLWNAAEASTTALLQLQIDGAAMNGGTDGVFSLEVKPGEPAVFFFDGTLDLRRCAKDTPCARRIVVRHLWAQASGDATLSLRPRAWARDVYHGRRDRGPEDMGPLLIREVE